MEFLVSLSYILKPYLKKQKQVAEKMASRLKHLLLFSPEDLGSVLGTHMTAHNHC